MTRPWLILVSLTLASAPAAAAPSAPDPLLVTGSVSGGAHDARKAHIELLWWPGEITSDQAPSVAGKVTDLPFVAATSTDEKGRFAIAAMPTAQMRSAAVHNDGWLNFMLVTYSGTDYLIEGLSRHWNGSGWSAFGDERPGMSPQDSRAVSFADDAVTGRPRYRTNPLPHRTRFSAGAAIGTPSGCQEVVEYYSTRDTVILEFHNSRDSDGRWEYGHTSDTDIDVGLEWSKDDWGASGSIHIGNSSSSAIGVTYTSAMGKYVATTFYYAHGHLRHMPDQGYTCQLDGTRFVRASSWAGVGYATPHDVSQYDCWSGPQVNYRSFVPLGGYFLKNAARAGRVPLAANFPFVSLGATSGYSTKVDMRWDARRNWIYVCGSNSLAAQAKIVYVS